MSSPVMPAEDSGITVSSLLLLSSSSSSSLSEKRDEERSSLMRGLDGGVLNSKVEVEGERWASEMGVQESWGDEKRWLDEDSRRE